MPRLRLPKRRTQPGAMPGMVVPDPQLPAPIIRVIAYDSEKIIEATLERPEQVLEYLGAWRVVWVDVDGLGHADTLAALAEQFGIHGLALEDVVNTHQRPKVESYEEQLFAVTRMVAREEGQTEQVSLFLGPGYVVSFNERELDCFDPVRRRIREYRGRIRQQGPDYLLYSLLDSVVDSFFPRLDVLGERLERLEDEVLLRPGPDVLKGINESRHELLGIRRIMGATREAVNSLIRDTGAEIEESTRIYLRDCYDHTVQIIDIVESQREIASGLIEMYLSSVSNRMNGVMKVLTIISTLFIPLTFEVGVYGMNFNTATSPWNMPELEWFYGYPLIMAIMLAIVIGELDLFWRWGWLWEPRRSKRKRRE